MPYRFLADAVLATHFAIVVLKFFSSSERSTPASATYWRCINFKNGAELDDADRMQDQCIVAAAKSSISMTSVPWPERGGGAALCGRDRRARALRARQATGRRARLTLEQLSSPPLATSASSRPEACSLFELSASRAIR